MLGKRLIFGLILGLSGLVAVANEGTNNDAAASAEAPPTSRWDIRGYKQLNDARTYSRDNNGIGILVYRGNDSGKFSWQDICKLFSAQFSKSGVETECHGDINDRNPEGTAIAYFLRERLYGWFNTSQAVAEIPAMVGRIKALETLDTKD